MLDFKSCPGFFTTDSQFVEEIRHSVREVGTSALPPYQSMRIYDVFQSYFQRCPFCGSSLIISEHHVSRFSDAPDFSPYIVSCTSETFFEGRFPHECTAYAFCGENYIPWGVLATSQMRKFARDIREMLDFLTSIEMFPNIFSAISYVAEIINIPEFCKMQHLYWLSLPQLQLVFSRLKTLCSATGHPSYTGESITYLDIGQFI